MGRASWSRAPGEARLGPRAGRRGRAHPACEFVEGESGEARRWMDQPRWPENRPGVVSTWAQGARVSGERQEGSFSAPLVQPLPRLHVGKHFGEMGPLFPAPGPGAAGGRPLPGVLLPRGAQAPDRRPPSPAHLLCVNVRAESSGEHLRRLTRQSSRAISLINRIRTHK